MSATDGLAHTAFGLCLRLALIAAGDPLKFDGEREFLTEVIYDFIKSDPEGTAQILHQIDAAKKVRVDQRVDRVVVYKCDNCEDRGWVRVRKDDPSSPRMTCRACSVRRGGVAI